MTEDQIKHMVNRFLGWKLPENFSPDAGISFKKTFNDHLPTPTKHEPYGTNLFDATQSDAMVRYMVEDMPKLQADFGEVFRHLDNACVNKSLKEANSAANEAAAVLRRVIHGLS